MHLHVSSIASLVDPLVRHTHTQKKMTWPTPRLGKCESIGWYGRRWILWDFVSMVVPGPAVCINRTDEVTDRSGTVMSDCAANSAIINWADLVTRVLLDADVPTCLGEDQMWHFMRLHQYDLGCTRISPTVSSEVLWDPCHARIWYSGFNRFVDLDLRCFPVFQFISAQLEPQPSASAMQIRGFTCTLAGRSKPPVWNPKRCAIHTLLGSWQVESGGGCFQQQLSRMIVCCPVALALNHEPKHLKWPRPRI